MRQLLFVDDEPKVLEGLKRLLRPLRHEWEMGFVSSGVEALELMERKALDVLVTDICMPGMDGAQLLAEARRRFPRVVRLALTGECSRDAVLQVVSLAHRQLTKPCDPEAFKETLTRVCALRELLNDESLIHLTSGLKSVPSLPALYLEVIRELEEPEPSLQKVGKIVSQDMGMTAKIMQVVNSAFFGLRRRANTPAQAVVLFGSEMTRVLVMAAGIFSQCDPSVKDSATLEALWRHSVATSDLARRIATAEQGSGLAADQAAMAGLLHDAGKLVLLANVADSCQGTRALVCNNALALAAAKQSALGARHAEVGAYLLGLWGLPDAVVEAVAWHHRPSDCPGQTFSPLTAVHVANALVHEGSVEEPGQLSASIDIEYLQRMGLLHRVDDWRDLRQPAGQGVSP